MASSDYVDSFKRLLKPKDVLVGIGNEVNQTDFDNSSGIYLKIYSVTFRRLAI